MGDRRVPAVAVLTAVAAALFIAAFYVADQIPADGDARLEAMTSALATVGATVVGAAFALAAVLWALGMETRRSAAERYRSHQADLIREAADWLRGLRDALGHVFGLLEEATNMPAGEARSDTLQAARARAQRFYDSEQDLAQAARIAELIDNADVKAAIAAADGLVRRWNEDVAGDHTTRAVTLPTELGGTLLSTYGSISDLHRNVEAELTRAIRQTWE